MARRFEIKLETAGSYFTVPINPISFDDKDSREFTADRTIDGYSFEYVPIFDGRPRTFVWNNIPNKEPYATMIANFRTYLGKRCNLKLNYLEKTGSTSTTALTIRVIDLTTTISSRAGPDSYTSNIIYDTISLTYVLV